MAQLALPNTSKNASMYASENVLGKSRWGHRFHLHRHLFWNKYFGFTSESNQRKGIAIFTDNSSRVCTDKDHSNNIIMNYDGGDLFMNNKMAQGKNSTYLCLLLSFLAKSVNLEI